MVEHAYREFTLNLGRPSTPTTGRPLARFAPRCPSGMRMPVGPSRVRPVLAARIPYDLFLKSNSFVGRPSRIRTRLALHEWNWTIDRPLPDRYRRLPRRADAARGLAREPGQKSARRMVGRSCGSALTLPDVCQAWPGAGWAGRPARAAAVRVYAAT